MVPETGEELSAALDDADDGKDEASDGDWVCHFGWDVA